MTLVTMYIALILPKEPVATWLLVLRRFGTLRLADILATPIGLAEHGFPMFDALRDAIAKVMEVFKADASVKTGLELTIPLIPLLLDYKLNFDLGSGLDLRQWWDNLKRKLQGGNE